MPKLFSGITAIMLCCSALHAQDKFASVLKNELQREYKQITAANKDVYYMSYSVDDITTYSISTSFGVLTKIDSNRSRIFKPIIRIGSYKLDNMHTNSNGGMRYSYGNSNDITTSDDEAIIQLDVWRQTDKEYKTSIEEYERIITNKKVKAAEEDTAADFSAVIPVTHHDEPIAYNALVPNIKALVKNLKLFSGILKQNPNVLVGNANIEFRIKRKYFVDTDGSFITENSTNAFQVIAGIVKAEDGMELPLYKTYSAPQPNLFPAVDVVVAETNAMSQKLTELLKAPLAEPYVGPAILSGRASGVFFHEIFGHRLEGKRMKRDDDAHTFKDKLGKEVLPNFISVQMDPTLKKIGDTYLNGHYTYDDEGVVAQKVTVVENGILKNFLMTRTPINGAAQSNGHARTAEGGLPESRQSNLLVTTTQQKNEQELRAMLLEAIKKQGKEYGYYFKDVQGGFTLINRTIPSSFNVLPIEVYKVYANGKPDELIRGVDLIGTPLSMFMKIAAVGNDTDVFNGMCGAGSGWVPVSASSPSILVDVIETQKKDKSKERAPIMPRPDLDK